MLLRISTVLIYVVLLLLFLFTGFYMSCAQTNMGPIRTPQINTNLYVGQSGYATIQSAVSFACRTGNQSFAVVILPGTAPADSPASVTGGCSGTYISDLRALPFLTYQWTGTSYAITASFSGIAHTTNLLMGDNNGNALDSGIASSNVALLNATLNNFIGTVHMRYGQVDNSPICTEATGCGGGGGATYPPAGIGVSTGSGWSDNSIDPGSLPAPGSSGQILMNLNGLIRPSAMNVSGNNFSVPGAITSGIATRLATGTDLNTITTCGNYDVANPVDGPPNIPSGNFVGVNNWCTGDSTYFIQFAWDMYGNPMQLYVRKNLGGSWLGWVTVVLTDYDGTLSNSGGIQWGSPLFVYGYDLNNLNICGMFQGTWSNDPPQGNWTDSHAWQILMACSGSNDPAADYSWQMAIPTFNWTGTATFFYRAKAAGNWMPWFQFSGVLATGSFTRAARVRQLTPQQQAKQEQYLNWLRNHVNFPSKTSRLPISPQITPIPLSTHRQASPLHSNSTCDPLEPYWNDANYLYVCTARNQIKRVALSSF